MDARTAPTTGIIPKKRTSKTIMIGKITRPDIDMVTVEIFTEKANLRVKLIQRMDLPVDLSNASQVAAPNLT